MCHLALLIPLAGLPLFWLLPVQFALPVNLLLWVLAIPVAVLVIQAMRRPVSDDFRSLLGKEATVVSDSGAPPARYTVRAGSELWSARSKDAFRPGDRASIDAIDGICLVIKRKA